MSGGLKLVRAPDDTLARLMACLELGFEPRQLDPAIGSPVVLARSLPWKGRALEPVDQTRIGHWRTTARSEDASFLNDALGPELEQFGYS
jgi:hypothetical protein